jgi:dCMP deaminase
MAMADSVGQRSLCSRAKIGCVIVTRDNRVESATYNGPAPAFDHHELECDHWCERMMTGEKGVNYDTCPSTHAEASAIARSDWSRLQGATLYVNGSCCQNCSKLIAQTGIKRVVHRVTESMAYRHPELVEQYLRSMLIEVRRAT